MFFNDAVALAVFWGVAAATFLVYLVLFVCARRPVSLRPRRLGALALAVLAGRLVLLAWGYPLAVSGDGLFTCTALLFAGVGLTAPRLFLIRSAASVFREQVQTACRGLFLQCEETRSGCFQLSAKTGCWRLRMLRLGPRLQLIVLPHPDGPGKAALLVEFLFKQYPGPVPRVRIVLAKE